MNFRYHHHSSSSLLTLYAPATIYIYTYNVAAVDNTYRWTTTWDVRVGNIVGGDNMYMTTICTVRIALHEIAYEARLCDKHTNYIHKTIKKILKQQHLWGDNMCSEVRHILSPTTICTCITFLSATICADGRQYVQWGSVHIVADDNMYKTTICTVTHLNTLGLSTRTTRPTHQVTNFYTNRSTSISTFYSCYICQVIVKLKLKRPVYEGHVLKLE